ncbi:MAG: bifunctional riboflavin kinase/FAD synthetase [Bacteroidota bacterium]|nr:bifunctional riboflavin kinase/FAD synthetase [Bacteroidota bacterium]
MHIIKDINDFEYDKKSVVTVGTFDGVHLGHLEIIEKLISIKKEKGLRSIVITFEPHPQVVLRNKTKDIKILSTLDEKLYIFKSLGIDIVYVINFTKGFSNTTAEEFYKNYLIDKIGLNDLVLGYDHMFGKNREGSFETLKILSQKYEFTVDKIDEFKIDGEHISSTVIRKLLDEDGNVRKVKRILGRYFSLEGEVVEGKKLGKDLGYPTANIEIFSEFKLIPKIGIYAVSIELDRKLHFGMMSIGKNPTVSSDDSIKLEVNIFDFDKDLYGKIITVNFIDYIRDEKKFESLEELKKQMSFDKEISLKRINEINNINN